MEFALFSSGEGLNYLFRWFHFVAGVCWIGLLYYFNFVQAPFFAETDAGTKSGAIQKLVPRALWYFRWAAMLTFITGIFLIEHLMRNGGGMAFFGSARGILLGIGMLMGTVMFLNVWLIIWPNQKIVIASTTAAAQGGKADPNAAAAGAKAMLASRTNTLFSVGMLFFMGAGAHLPLQVNPDANLTVLAAVIAVIIGAIELNAIKGKLGPIASVKGVIHMAFVLAIVLYLATEFLTK